MRSSVPGFSVGVYRGTSLTRTPSPLATYSRTMPRALRWSYGVGAVSYEGSTHAGFLGTEDSVARRLRHSEMNKVYQMQLDRSARHVSRPPGGCAVQLLALVFLHGLFVWAGAINHPLMQPDRSARHVSPPPDEAVPSIFCPPLFWMGWCHQPPARH